MEEFKRIIDYVIEQADRNDAKNLQFEQDIIFNIERSRDKIFSRMLSRAQGCINLTQMTEMLHVMDTLADILEREFETHLLNKFAEYAQTGYDNTSQLIETGLDVEKRFSERVSEIRIDRDNETIKYIQEHAFDMLSGYTSGLIQSMRASLGDLILKNSADRATVQKLIQRILDTNSSKAKEIAQTELSRAYNTGVLERLKQYYAETGVKPKKYWHGFKYSAKTCGYCYDRIGRVYDYDDDSEQLPAHPRCRCIWLPVLDGWDKPIDTGIISRANMLTTGYSEDQLYSRLNSRLGIDYAENMNIDDVVKYLEGDRTPSIMSKIGIARESAIEQTKDSFNITQETGTDTWSKRFNQQMSFWKNLVAESIVDKDKDKLEKYYEGIKAVTLLPWSGEQLDKWNKLLKEVSKELS